MGQFSSEYGLVARAVNALTPEGHFGLDQNTRLMKREKPFYEAEIASLRMPDEQQRALGHELTDNITIGRPNTGQFGALWLNRDAIVDGNNPPVVSLNGFMGNLTGLDDKMRAYFMARAMPDRQILMIEEPSHGKSDKASREEIRELCNDGQATLIGTRMHRAVQSFFEANASRFETSDLRGDSFGARIALDVAKADIVEGSDIFQSLQVFELPGTRDRRFRIHASYFLYEWLRSNNYRTPWLETTKQDFTNYLDTNGDFDTPQTDFFHRDPKAAFKNFANSILGRSTGLGVLTELVENGLPITRIAGGASRIDNPYYARQEWDDLRTADDLGGFVLGIAQNASHDALGALTNARLRGRLIASLLDHPLDSIMVERPFTFNPVDLSSDSPIGPLEFKYAA